MTVSQSFVGVIVAVIPGGGGCEVVGFPEAIGVGLKVADLGDAEGLNPVHVAVDEVTGENAGAALGIGNRVERAVIDLIGFEVLPKDAALDVRLEAAAVAGGG